MCHPSIRAQGHRAGEASSDTASRPSEVYQSFGGRGRRVGEAKGKVDTA